METSKKVQLAIAMLGILAIIVMLVLMALPPSQKPANQPDIAQTQNDAVVRNKIDAANAGITKVDFSEGSDSDWKNQSTRILIQTTLESQELPIYSASGIFVPLGKESARGLATSFGFSGVPLERGDGTGVVWKWQDKTRNLIINLDQKTFQYAVDFYTDTSLINEGEDVDLAEARNAAVEYVQRLGLDKSYVDMENIVVKALGGHGGHVDEEEGESTIARVTFPYTLSGKQVYLPGDYANGIEVDVTNTGQVVGVRAFYHDGDFYEYKPAQLYPLSEGQAVLPNDILIVQNLIDQLPAGMLRKVIFDEVSTLYYGRNKELGYIVPFYLLSGKGENLDGEVTEVVAYMAAY